MELLSQAIRATLLATFRQQQPLRDTDREIDFYPVVKLFDPCAAFLIEAGRLRRIDA